MKFGTARSSNCSVTAKFCPMLVELPYFGRFINPKTYIIHELSSVLVGWLVKDLNGSMNLKSVLKCFCWLYKWFLIRFVSKLPVSWFYSNNLLSEKYQGFFSQVITLLVPVKFFCWKDKLFRTWQVGLLPISCYLI